MKPNHVGAFLLIILSTYAGADVYKHVDENGRVTYGITPREGVTKLNLEPSSTKRTKKSAVKSAKKGTSSKTANESTKSSNAPQKPEPEKNRSVMDL